MFWSAIRMSQPVKMALGGISLEGLFAINKPTKMSSAQALRSLQYIFRKSPMFKDSLKAERDRRRGLTSSQRGKRKSFARPQVKLGHGGTLDPMATGVLVVGIGSGTKQLPTLLGGEKEYEAVMLLGADTDTYDRLGKVVKKAPWGHVTRELVERELEKFKGDIMQVPPIYSALNMNGKRLYEYARSGEPLPMEIKPRPVRVERLELVEFTTDHDWEFPEEASEDEKKVADYVEKEFAKTEASHIVTEALEAKKQKTTPGEDVSSAHKATTALHSSSPTGRQRSRTPPRVGKPPIIRVRLTTSSGFYVRSFIHDLGLALNSAAHMVALVRTRQSSWALGKGNTIEWSEFKDDAPSSEYNDEYDDEEIPGIDLEEEEEVYKPEKKWEIKLVKALIEYNTQNPVVEKNKGEASGGGAGSKRPMSY